MATWLFDSSGHPKWFVVEGGDGTQEVFSREGLPDFVGRLDGSEVWHGDYLGEIIDLQGLRVLYNTRKGRTPRPIPPMPSSPTIPAIPTQIMPVMLPPGYRDI